MQDLSHDTTLHRSLYVEYFQHGEDFYIYHNLFGYILKLSRDVIAFLEFFRPGRTLAQALQRFGDTFLEDDIRSFIETFGEYSCLNTDEEEEEEEIWRMFPVKAHWIVYFEPDEGSTELYYTDLMGNDGRIELDDWEKRLWASVDGNQALSVLFRDLKAEEDPIHDDLKTKVSRFIKKMVHYNHQFLKLSRYPVSFYRHRSYMMPPYLRSTMPYNRYDPINETVEEGPVEQDGLADISLSYLFRRPHVALGGKSYGERLIDTLIDEGHLVDSTTTVLDLGGGKGYVARDVIATLEARFPATVGSLEYHLLVPDAEEEAATREVLGEVASRVTFVHGDMEQFQVPQGKYDCIIANECLGSFRCHKIHRSVIDLAEAPDAFRDSEEPHKFYESIRERLLSMGEPGELIYTHSLPLADAPEEFYLNTGALVFLSDAWQGLKPGGRLVVTDFGEEYQYPFRASSAKRPIFLIHFGHLKHVARDIGFGVEYSYVIDFLAFDRDSETLATTGHYFSSLKQLLSDHDVALEKVAYTKEMFQELVGDALDLSKVHNLFYERLEDRVLGVVPHQFKIAIMHKPEEPEETEG